MTELTTSETEQLRAENEQLKATIEALEQELVDVQTRANAAVAKWEERAYWLDRLHIDLNAMMERPGANEVRVTLKLVRELYWKLKRLVRRLRGQ